MWQLVGSAIEAARPPSPTMSDRHIASNLLPRLHNKEIALHASACSSPIRHAVVIVALGVTATAYRSLSSKRQHAIVVVDHSRRYQYHYLTWKFRSPSNSAEVPYVPTTSVPSQPGPNFQTCTDELTDLTTTTCHACSTDGTLSNPRSSHTRARVLSTQSRSMSAIGS
jgi:hypothetical protein